MTTEELKEMQMDKSPLDRILIEPMTLIHIRGIPYVVQNATWVYGRYNSSIDDLIKTVDE